MVKPIAFRLYLYGHQAFGGVLKVVIAAIWIGDAGEVIVGVYGEGGRQTIRGSDRGGYAVWIPLDCC